MCTDVLGNPRLSYAHFFSELEECPLKQRKKLQIHLNFDSAIVTGELVCLCLTPVFQGINKTHALN